MAAITTAASPQGSQFRRIGTAQADTGQTDWVIVPAWAKYATVVFSITAITATSGQLALLTVDPVALNDTFSGPFAGVAAFTAKTAAKYDVVHIGPGVTGIANAVTGAAAANVEMYINAVLPPIIGLQYIEVVGGGSVTYNLSITFRK